MLARLHEGIRDLFPGYFALVMATGIVSLASHFLGMPLIAYALFYLNIAQYVLLWILTLARVFLAWEQVKADLTGHALSPAFLTIVAGTCILGQQFLVLAEGTEIAAGLWFLGAFLWLVLSYTFFTSVTVREAKPSLEEGINGAWLLAVVSTQSVSVLGMMLAGTFGEHAPLMLFLSLCLYLLGCLFYLLIITLIFYRFTFFPLRAQNLTPPYWINMGAVAITALAGARLLLQSGDFKLLESMRPFLQGFTLFFWAAATWWIPLLVILGGWRHVIQRVPLPYHPSCWAIVFPLGMYTASTYQLALALDLPFLLYLPRCFIFAALAAWGIVFLAMLVSSIRFLLANQKVRQG